MTVYYYGPDPEQIEAVLKKIHQLLVVEANDIEVLPLDEGGYGFSFNGYSYEVEGPYLIRFSHDETGEGVEIDLKTDKSSMNSKMLMDVICRHVERHAVPKSK